MGDETKSHLFRNFGNYFGTWQRIDIPNFINAEYALLLDCDTIVMTPFTFADFTKKMTKSIALSAEFREDVEEPWNAGVLLMNLPYLRETYDDFLEFIKAHRGNPHPYVINLKGGGTREAPSDQGAYLSFYADSKEFLSTDFNDKPYYKHAKRTRDTYKIMHFHGAKPHDYLGSLMGLKCDRAVQFLCDMAVMAVEKMPNLCRSLKVFADALTSDRGDRLLEFYCSTAFDKHGKAYFDKCYNFFSMLSKINVAKLEKCNEELLLSFTSINDDTIKR